MGSHPRLLALALSATGLGVFAYKVFVLHFPVRPSATTSVWTVEADVAFRAKGKPVQASLFTPTTTEHFLVSDERFVSQDFWLSSGPSETDHQVTWSARTATGRQHVVYRAVIRQVDHIPVPRPSRPEVPGPRIEARLLAAARRVVSRLQLDSADTCRHVRDLVVLINSARPDPNVRQLLGTAPTTPIRKAELAVSLLALAHVPARLVHGIDLSRTLKNAGVPEPAEIVEWIEVYENGAWHPHNLRSGEAGISSSYLPWWHGSEPLWRVNGADYADGSVLVEQREEEAMQSALTELKYRTPTLFDFSLFGLPAHTQMVYRVLLLIPIGAFIVVLLHNLVGIKTFGTFAPTLLALSFRETRLAWGLVLFSVIIGISLAVRLYLGRFKLLAVPRLACVLVVLVLLMIVVSIVAHRFGLEEGISVALFPMVVITMAVERMSTIWDELGPRSALSLGMGTLIVSILTFGIINLRIVEHLTFAFSELLLVVLGGCLLLGRYTGYRLVELGRFKALAAVD